MYNKIPPDLNQKFLPQPSWQQHSFVNPETNHAIAYSSMFSVENKKNILILPGLSEFSEKYIETASFFFNHGFNVYVIDWAYQGRSIRLEKNYQKRHSDGYDTDLSDLNFMITTYIGKQKPLFILAHSMGSHIAMRYLSEFDHFVKAVSLSAPMLKIKHLALGQNSSLLLAQALSKFGYLYVPGGKNWSSKSRGVKDKDVFSSDPIRKELHREWSAADEQLRLGSPTVRWLRETLISMTKLRKNYHKIKIPAIFTMSGLEDIIDNREIKLAAGLAPNSTLLEYKNAKHEILMETDDIRDDFLNKTLELFN